jgi:Bacterial membrane protein YfhO
MQQGMRANGWQEWWQRRRADAAALGVIVCAFCAAFGWAILRGRFLIGGDVFFYTYPLRTILWRMIRAGQLPIWTPLVFSGYPLLAMVQLGVGYPLTWAHLFLPDHWAEELYVLAPFLLAPAFTYAYAREIGRSRLAALLAGLTYAYGGLMTNTYGMNGIPTNALMWLPLVLVAIERARRALFASCLVGAALAYAMSVLTGHAQSFLLVGLVAGAYALCLALAPVQEEEAQARATQPRAWWPRWRPLFVAVGAGALGAGVAAFQILETARAARRSVRHAISYEYFSAGAFTPREALRSFVVPLDHYVEVTTYVVPLACVLAVYAVVQLARGKTARDPRLLFWLVVACASFILMLGANTPLYSFVYRVPVVNLFRTPSRHAFEWTFALAVLAAYGWDALRGGSAARVRGGLTERRAFVVGVLLVALGAACGVLWWLAVNGGASFLVGAATERAYIVWKITCTICVLLALWCAQRVTATRRRAALLASVLVLGCLGEPLVLIRKWWAGTAKSAARFTTPGQATHYLEQFPPAEGRVYTYANLGLDENSPAPRFDVLDQTAPYGLHNVGGYEQLLLTRYSRALGDVDYDAVRPRAGHDPARELFAAQSHVLDLLNTTHVVAFSELAHMPAAPLDPARWQTVAEFDGVVVLRNARALPRAWLVADAEVVDGEEALDRIRGAGMRCGFEPQRTALVEAKPAELPHLPGGALAPGSSARVVAYEPSRLQITTDAQTPTVLVVSEISYPGWKATVDGTPARIMLTDYLLRGIALPAGKHEVEMRYAAPAARTGAIISACALLLICGLFVYARRPRRRMTKHREVRVDE